MKTDDLYRRIEYAQATKVNNVDREPAIRLYCTSLATTWSLQVRGPTRIARGKEGRDFIVASASLHVADMRALRDAIDGFLKEAEE